MNKKIFYCNDYYFDNHRIFFVYGDKNAPISHRKTYIVLAGGAGDVFIFLPIIYQIQKNRNCRFIALAKNIYDVLCKLGFHNILEFVDDPMISYLLVDSKYKPFPNFVGMFLNLSSFYESENKSRFELFCDYYREIDLIPGLSYQKIFNEFKRNFPYQWKKPNNSKIKVAIQRLSSSKDENGYSSKEWPQSETRKLITYCNSNNIELINVCPHDNLRNEYSADEGHQTFAGLLEFLCNINVFIGIDSSIGHLCALTGTPNINLYFSKSEHRNYYSHTFMPLSMSYTLFAQDQYPRFETIVSVMNLVLSESIQLSSEFIPLMKRKENIHYEFV